MGYLTWDGWALREGLFDVTFEPKLVLKSGEESSRQRELQVYPASDPGAERSWVLRVEHNKQWEQVLGEGRRLAGASHAAR